MPTNTTQYIAVIGPQEIISLLESVGIDAYSAKNSEEARTQLQDIRNKNTYGIVCITEGITKTFEKKMLSELQNSTFPTVLIIPDLQSVPGSGVEKIRELAKRATGSDILAQI
jgi:vacuolar-type H+-ATPase subunit F/Vma7